MSELFKILDENGTPVAYSWHEATETGALSFFAGPGEGCEVCGSRRYITSSLACWHCANPPAPTWTDVAPDYATAIARGFRLYTSPDPCLAVTPMVDVRQHGRVRTTSSRRCTACERDEVVAEREAVLKERAAKRDAEAIEVRRLMAEERAVYRASTTEARKVEAVARIITHTVGSTKARYAERLKRHA